MDSFSEASLILSNFWGSVQFEAAVAAALKRHSLITCWICLVNHCVLQNFWLCMRLH